MSKPLDPDSMPVWLAALWPKKDRDPAIIAGIDDDDCAVVRLTDNLLVITVDYLNARPIAVQLGLADLSDLGRLVVAITISDLCGSGAAPTALLTGITMERTATEQDFQLLMRGIRKEADRWGVPVIGGDTKLGSARALLTVGIGTAESEKNLFLKNRARPGELLWCSGQLGSCNAAALGLKEGQCSPEWNDWAKNAILVPDIPLAKSRTLSTQMLGNAGIDISDGLGADLHRLCRASNVGVAVDATAVPVHPNVQELAQKIGVPAWAFAFCGGGDFQFLMTSSKSAAARVAESGCHLIGEISDAPQLVLKVGTERFALPDSGHRDVRGMSFLEEITTLLGRITKPEGIVNE